MTRLMLIAVGGGIGSVLRYLIGGWVQRAGGANFPWGTMAVNILGCLAIGFLSAAFAGRWVVRDDIRLGLLVGVLGGFTTFSTFGLETLGLLSGGQVMRAIANVAASVAFGLVAAWLGLRVGQAWLGL